MLAFPADIMEYRPFVVKEMDAGVFKSIGGSIRPGIYMHSRGIRDIMKKYDCDIVEFTTRMAAKHPDNIKLTGEVGTLADKSSSNTIVLKSRVSTSGRYSAVAEKVKEWEGMFGEGTIDVEEWEETVEGFLTLKNPCDEKTVDKAVEEDFYWED